LDIEVIKATKNAGKVSIPGAFTATEILSAHNHGADIVKVFPAPDAAYIKNILAPLNHVRLMPTGGIDATNIMSFKATGAVAFGIGSALVKTGMEVNETNMQALSARAYRLITALNS
jgi:2-dehydro-3-deoxyphosphogluconate aldolase/(4S)-4-hydroxy-2-oxoglutarate aldolase